MIKHFLLIILACLALSASADSEKVYTPAEVPNVHLQNRLQFVSDPDSLLSAGARAQADSRLRALMDTTGVEVAIVVLPSIGDRDIYEFTHELASSWGVGKADKNSGVLVVFDMAGHKVRIHTGKGVEGILPDVACNHLISDVVVPNMRTGDLDDAVTDLSDKFYDIFTDPEAAKEVASEQQNDADTETADLLMLMLYLALMVGAGTYIFTIYKLIRISRRPDYEKAIALRDIRTYMWIFTLISLGTALPCALLIQYLARYYRNHKRKCQVCGTEMEKLDEATDNQYLTPAQDLEENLNSVDYDVWLCPKCGSREIYPFVQPSKYQPCPHCHTRAYSLQYDRITRRPTATTEGMGVKGYGCLNCHCHKDVPYRIERTAPPVIIVPGGGGGHGGSGGGFSGGSWGGGSFGGGGATGSW